MRLILVFVILLFSCNPNLEKPLSLDEKKSYEAFKEVRIADLALESYDPNIRDSMRSIFLDMISSSLELSVPEIEKLLIEIQKQPKIHKRYIDQYRQELDSIEKMKREVNKSIKKN